MLNWPRLNEMEKILIQIMILETTNPNFCRGVQLQLLIWKNNCLGATSLNKNKKILMISMHWCRFIKRSWVRNGTKNLLQLETEIIQIMSDNPIILSVPTIICSLFGSNL